MGIVMIIGGIIGMAACIIMLCLFPSVFRRQKKELLEEIENGL